LGAIFTFAGNGNGTEGGDGGPATSASLYPYNVAFDSVGNVYIVESQGSRIRKVDHQNNKISTVAGNGSFSYGGNGLPATSASLKSPWSVTVDQASGDLYIADTGNSVIRMVNATTQIITTVAGNGTAVYGGDGQAATNAAINGPFGTVFDSAGNMYIVGAYENRIRMVNATTQVITTVAGNGTAVYGGDGQAATSAGIHFPYAIAFDTIGNLYIADNNNNVVRMVNVSTQIISTVAGNGTAVYGGDGQAATSASLRGPSALAFDTSGNLYICDSNSSRVRMVNASTQIITTVAGNGSSIFAGDGQAATSASLNFPNGVSVDTLSGNLYISDTYNHRVRIVYV
jgi:hypothetical protein